ncbi:Hypothetical predicted protein [Paramuricea clavata]|uniref:Uncharacterized protein n=1 Tax=Paramuricea clavata TaxID=317549 RepID=A0A6S7GLA8_PARCT|nr:Hypothetical predicted protein [Paramuricea clavata]
MFKGKPGIVCTDSERYRTARTGLIYGLQLLYFTLVGKPLYHGSFDVQYVLEEKEHTSGEPLIKVVLDDSEIAPKISGCSTPRLFATGLLEEISSISLIAEGMVVKNSDTIRAILPTQWHVCLQGTMF